MVKRNLIFDKNKEEIKLEVVVDLEPFLNELKERRQSAGKGYSKDKNLRAIGSIPIHLLMTLPPEVGLGVLYGNKEIQDWLFNKYPFLRTSEGEL